MVIHDVDRNHYHYLSTVPPFVTKHQSELEYFQLVVVDDSGITNDVYKFRDKIPSDDFDPCHYNDADAILVHITDQHQHIFYCQGLYERYGKYGVAH